MKPLPFRITRYLLLLVVITLAVFGVGSLLWTGANTALYRLYALIMFGDAVLILFCYVQMKTKTKYAYWLAFTVLALNIILTIFDQVGVIDILFMLVNLVTLIALYLSRKEFLPA